MEVIQRRGVDDQQLWRHTRNRVVQGRRDVAVVIVVIVDSWSFTGSASVKWRSKAVVIVAVFVVILNADANSTYSCWCSLAFIFQLKKVVNDEHQEQEVALNDLEAIGDFFLLKFKTIC